MNYSDVPVLIACGGEPMVGIVSRPVQPCALGLLIVVGGPQYRVGSHRQFVLLARCLAQAGFAVMRFDYRGMGDSGGDARSFELVDDDIAAAVAALQQACPAVMRVVLWGLCDGASASLMYVGRQSDARIAGLCLLNPWVRSEATLARTRLKYYYTARFLQREFWIKLRLGQFDWRRALMGLWQNMAESRQKNQTAVDVLPFQHMMAMTLRQFPGQVLLILSGNDYTAKEFLECAATDPDWRGLLQRPGLQRLDLADADHTFSRSDWRATTEQAVLGWLASLR